MLADNPKYISIFRTGKDLFWKYGVKRVTIEEICREAKVSKMTFYKYFQNKMELVETILEDLFNSSLIKFNEIITGNLSFSEKLEKIFLLKIEGMNNFSIEFIKDIYNNPDTGLKDIIDGKSERFKEVVINFYKEAQSKGFIREDIKIDFILAYSAQIKNLMKDESLIAQYNEPQDFVIECMNLLFYGIVTGDE